jgi:hypothetical protein
MSLLGASASAQRRFAGSPFIWYTSHTSARLALPVPSFVLNHSTCMYVSCMCAAVRVCFLRARHGGSTAARCSFAMTFQEDVHTMSLPWYHSWGLVCPEELCGVAFHLH